MDLPVRIALVAVIFVAATMASGAGTGGGALYIPGYIVSLKDVHKAVPLSKVTIFGGCLVSVLINIRRRNPKSNTPMIAYELAALMEPFTLLGAIIGVLLNIVMTDLQILVCLVVTLSFTSYKTFRKGLAQRAEETRILKELEQRRYKEQVDNELGSLAPVVQGENRSELERLLPPMEEDSRHTEGGASLERSLKRTETEDTTYFPISDSLLDIQDAVAVTPTSRVAADVVGYCRTCQVSCIYLVFDSVVNVVLLILAGGPVAVLCGSQWQQGCIYLLLSIHVLGTFLFARWLIKMRKQLEAAGEKSMDVASGGLGWLTPVTAFVYPLLSMMAGVLAGAIGIGGGLVKGPLLLEIGLSPLAAVSTANFMIFFTSSANTLQYATLGRLDLADSICFFFTAFVAGATHANSSKSLEGFCSPIFEQLHVMPSDYNATKGISCSEAEMRILKAGVGLEKY
ncbi:hypothetical protein cyc_07766 [Cyclospora cayetanensis]|uniref:Uncharacterized protein n=1 Tax=Cyclospora cayetanensis TaxID=88456 RepID=A0A1D3D3Q3_9EIME|nr:hypothetical protein cyc_07766 [Cyclospora cayetanensis]